MKLLIIRHGESEADLLNVHEGRADYPLTERGECQARAMAEYVSTHYDLTKIYCSTLKRAYRTAELLSEASGAVLTPDDRLREFNNGLLAGLDRETAREKYPIVPDVQFTMLYTGRNPSWNSGSARTICSPKSCRRAARRIPLPWSPTAA